MFVWFTAHLQISGLVKMVVSRLVCRLKAGDGIEWTPSIDQKVLANLDLMFSDPRCNKSKSFYTTFSRAKIRSAANGSKTQKAQTLRCANAKIADCKTCKLANAAKRC